MSQLPVFEDTTAIYRTADPTLESAEFGTVYHVKAPRAGDPWVLYNAYDDCGVSFVEPLEVPECWDDAYEFAMADTRIWRRITSLALDADLAHADLEIAFVPVYDAAGMVVDSKALLYRFTWPY